MGPRFLLTFFAMACLVFSFIKGAPFAQSEVLAIGKDSRSYDHENLKFTNYIQKLRKGWRIKEVMNKEEENQEGLQTEIQVNDAQRIGFVAKARFVRHAARCLTSWSRCFKKSKRKQNENRNQRTENREGSSSQNGD